MVGLYAALELAPEDEIRLLNIPLKRQTEDIACELQVVKLRDNPKYIALSYTWGSPTSLNNEEGAEDISSKPSRLILCKAKSNSPAEPQPLWYRIMVTENLYTFLLKARDDESHALDFYWIDTICINQKDSEERTRQVNMMAAIYQSADIVHAWLGEEDKDTGMTFQLIRALASCCTGNERHKRIEGLKDITPKALGTRELTAKLGACADISNWKSMAMLFHRRYFTRAWTIQEITLAKKMLALCGSHTIDWEDIVKVSEFLTVTSWTRWISEVTGSHQANHAVPNILDANKTSGNILYSLIRSRRFMSGDPRDKVYALLGVAGDSVRGKSRLTPVYGKRSVAETYTLAAIQILEDSDDLLLLSCAEGDSFHTLPSLPSWVPDWSCSRALGLGVTGYRRYSAAATIPRTLEINESDRCLTVKGFRLDDIVSVGENKQDILSGKPFPNWLLIINAMPPIYYTGQSRFEVFWRTLITDTAGTPPCHPAPHSYRPAYVSWITSKLSACVNETAQQTGDSTFINALGALAATEIPGSPLSSNRPLSSHDNERPGDSKNSIDLDEYETTFSHARHLRLFLTSRRYLGVGSESLLEHDSIWIIPGSRVPLILREVNPSAFRVVGGAYVHGFMKGEALESNPLFRDITII
ncbi:HET-domain-containing protein [Zopfia rhizophila CBS 207.26]|uniref:HET-domain-containing protein n=1 Tax=Zopfia rhizophila CBS 207.26 TaxID=1314779 RepID=A0A6A6EQA1_9PEZI|nr:HET-domain-containing protein [Zopfia rhizophila CBS 207.26]